jgi:uroporphyrinogen decarboxylase
MTPIPDVPNADAIFPSVNEKWHKHAEKRFASPFTGSKFDRIDVDPMMLSHAALITGYTINDFYTNPALGARCVANASEMYDLLPVTHWYFSLPWVAELGAQIEFKPFLPPVVKEPTIKDIEAVDKLEVPDLKEMENGWTGRRMIEAQDYVQEHLPKMFIPMTYTSDLTGGGAQLCGIAEFIMWTLTERDACKKLVSKYTEVAINGAELMANRYGMAMISTGSVLANNDIFSDTDVNDLSVKYLNTFVDQALRKGAGPQLLYHLCGNHETDYKLFKDHVPFTPFTIFHIGYKGREVFPSDLLMKEYGDRATIMGSVDTKIMILPNPKKVYDQAKEQLIRGRDSKYGYILGTACELPPDALPANVHALVQAARDYGTYGTW